MNYKMTQVATEIFKVMTEVFPKKHLEFIFCGLLDPGDVVEMVMLDLIKNAYDTTADKHSLRYFYEKYGITEIHEIMRYSRLIQTYVMRWRQHEYDRRKENLSEEFMEELSALLLPDMSDMSTKLEGYRLTEMNFFELTTMLENEFPKLNELTAKNKRVLKLLQEVGLNKIIFGRFTSQGVKETGTMSIFNIDENDTQDIVKVKFNAETGFQLVTDLYFPKGIGRLLNDYFKTDQMTYQNVTELLEKI